MSYNLTVVSKDGQVTVTATGDVPEGKHVVHGHQGHNDVTLGVTRYGTAGNVLGAANSQHIRSDA